MGASIFPYESGAVEIKDDNLRSIFTAWPQCICFATDAFMGRAFQEFGEGTISDCIHPTKAF